MYRLYLPTAIMSAQTATNSTILHDGVDHDETDAVQETNDNTRSNKRMKKSTLSQAGPI